MTRNKHRICIDDIKCDWDHDKSFDKSTDYALDLDIKDSNELILEEECNLWEPRYISHHLMSATIFFVYFAIAGFTITLLHESFQSFFYIAGGYAYGGMEITIDSGVTFSTVPMDASFLWYLLVFVGPSIFIEGSILLVLAFNIKYEVKPVFLDSVRNRSLQINTIKKAFGWFSAVKLIAVILFFPITNLAYYFLGESKTSDLTMAWQSTNYVSNPYEVLIMQILIIVSNAILLTLSGLYLYSVKRTSTVK